MHLEAGGERRATKGLLKESQPNVLAQKPKTSERFRKRQRYPVTLNIQ